MEKILKDRDITIHAGFSVKAPAYTLFKDDFPVKIAKFLAGKRRNKLKPFYARENEILKIIYQKEVHKLESTNLLTNIYGEFLHNKIMDVFKISDMHFKSSVKCIQCDLCINMCPRNNIKRNDNSLIWNNNCELCYGCMVRCQHDAIEYKGEIMTKEKRIRT